MVTPFSTKIKIITLTRISQLVGKVAATSRSHGGRDTLRNIISLKDLLFMNFSYNSLSRFVPSKEGYKRFPGAFVGNQDLYVEFCREKCDAGSLPIQVV